MDLSKRWWLLLIATAAGQGCLGCPGAEVNLGFHDGGLDLITAARALERTQCDRFIRCGWEDPLSDCKRLGLIADALPASLYWDLIAEDAGLVSVDEPRLQLCIDEMNTAACEAGALGCSDWARGSRSSGATCGSRYECLDGLYCDISSQCPGVCRPQGQVGESVSRVWSGCGEGLAAVVDTSGPVSVLCQAPARTGQSCSPGGVQSITLGRACAEITDFCRVPADGGPGRCESAVAVRRPARGEPCAYDRPCQAGLACVEDGPNVGHCDIKMTAGASCRLDRLGCATGFACSRQTQVCIALPRFDEACGESPDQNCPVGAICRQGFCRRIHLPGEACGVSDYCYDSECLNGLCTPSLCDPWK
jgi:hypothetical protein